MHKCTVLLEPSLLTYSRSTNIHVSGAGLFDLALLARKPEHFLSPYIDSEVNHKRHFIKILFINKGIEFIDLYSIFKDSLVISSIPNYFNSETPIICYKYNKPIRSTIFNFDKIVTDIDTDSNTPDS